MVLTRRLRQGHHYQIACKKYFDLTHPGNSNQETGISHPNSYFRDSVTYWKEKNGVKEEPAAAPKEDAAPPSAGGSRSALLAN